jgi:ectoine hydroxylase-related dioxygenase (phytanoyl-CoA dioxygenase family)
VNAAEVFVERGWVVVDLREPGIVADIGAQLLAWLRAEAAPGLERLEHYHEHVTDDAAHERVHVELADRYWDARLGHRIVASELEFLRRFVALDLHVQRHPYLRIARPGRARDVTGVHRDLDYGASPYEVSIVVPFTDLDTDNALRVVSGSHTEALTAYPATRTEADGVTPGSPRHRLGFPYAPQVLGPEVDARAEPVPLHVGQALLMSLGLVHGQTLNGAPTTRFTTDVRVVNSLAPVAFARGVRDDYYEPLCASPVTEQAHRQLDHDG